MKRIRHTVFLFFYVVACTLQCTELVWFCWNTCSIDVFPALRTCYWRGWWILQMFGEVTNRHFSVHSCNILVGGHTEQAEIKINKSIWIQCAKYSHAYMVYTIVRRKWRGGQAPQTIVAARRHRCRDRQLGACRQAKNLASSRCKSAGKTAMYFGGWMKSKLFIDMLSSNTSLLE